MEGPDATSPGTGAEQPFEGARLFVKLFWGFSPSVYPIVTFSQRGSLNRLLRLSQPRDLVVFLGTSGPPTPEVEWGKILGMAEFGRDPFNAERVFGSDAFPPDTRDAHGRFRWPFAVAMTRAWRFLEPRRRASDLLGIRIDQTIAANVRALDAGPAREVLALPLEAVELPNLPALRSMRAMSDALAANRAPSRGPAPSSWGGLTVRDATGAAFTYALRFGERDVWKIGWADDPAKRAVEIGLHVPEEAIGENWRLQLRQRWHSADAAYAMEQRLLSILGPKRTQGERVACSEGEMNAAWAKAMRPLTP